MIDGALGAAGTNAAAVGLDKLGKVGVLYHGLSAFGGGATLAGIILGAVTVFIIDRQLEKAAAFARGRRGPHLLRLHPRRGDRDRPVAGRRARLSRRRRDAVRLRPTGGDRPGRAERHRSAQCERRGAGGIAHYAPLSQRGRGRVGCLGGAKPSSGRLRRPPSPAREKELRGGCRSNPRRILWRRSTAKTRSVSCRRGSRRDRSNNGAP